MAPAPPHPPRPHHCALHNSRTRAPWPRHVPMLSSGETAASLLISSGLWRIDQTRSRPFHPRRLVSAAANPTATQSPLGTLPRAPQHGVRAVPKCLASYVLILSPLPLRVAIPTAKRHAVAVASCYTDSERRSTDAPSRRSTQAMRRTRLIRHPCALAVEIRHSEAGGCMSRIAFRRAGPGRWVLGPPVGWGGGRGLLLLHTRAHRHPCVEPRAYYAVFCGTVALLGDSSAAQKTHNHAFQQLVSSSSDQRPEQLGSNVLEL